MSFHALAPESKQKAVYRKYSNPKRGAVSLYSPAKKLLSILSLSKKKEATVNLRRLLLLIFFSLSGDAITAVVYHRSDDTILFRSYFLLFALISILKT